MLGGLMEVATRFSRFLLHEIMPTGAEPKRPYLAFRFSGNPVAALKRVTRAARSAAILYMKIQKQIAAWKAGEPFDLGAFLAEAPRLNARSKIGLDGADRDEEDWEDLEELEDLEEFENLVEHESFERFGFLEGSKRSSKDDKYQALLKGPLKDAIAAICKDLGIKPDWSLWTANGFPAPPGGGVEDWVAFFVPEAAAAPAPRPDRHWLTAQAPPCPEDEAGAKAWRRRWIPRERHERPPPLYGAAARPPDPRGSP
jgi:hypothetical protein